MDKEEDIDGTALEDVDGIPLEEIDGIPLDGEALKDTDDEPIKDDDIDGEPCVYCFSALYIINNFTRAVSLAKTLLCVE